mmetsp:Transcript_10717/g.33982  ORF Transcript_10717/g.33982 Transcript_10717/m.33982 type:complete len:281 (+) Transcript_10717:265-1107(+)
MFRTQCSPSRRRPFRTGPRRSSGAAATRRPPPSRLRHGPSPCAAGTSWASRRRAAARPWPTPCRWSFARSPGPAPPPPRWGPRGSSSCPRLSWPSKSAKWWRRSLRLGGSESECSPATASTAEPVHLASVTTSAWTRRCCWPRPSAWSGPSGLAVVAQPRRRPAATLAPHPWDWSEWPSSPWTRQMLSPMRIPAPRRWETSSPGRRMRGSCCSSRRHGLTERRSSRASIAGRTPSCSMWGQRASRRAAPLCSTSRWSTDWPRLRTSSRRSAKRPHSWRAA